MANVDRISPTASKSVSVMRRTLWHRLASLAVSAGFIVALLAVCLRLRHINDATVALLMVLCIFGIATKFGSAEALIAAVAGGVGFDFFFLPPHGFGIEAPEHWVALTAFSVTAIATGQLAARAKRRRIQAEQQQQEVEKLYQLVNALLDSGTGEATIAELANRVATIFGADGVAIYDKHAGQIFRSGLRADTISDQALYEAATVGCQLIGSTFSLIPLPHGSQVAGSIGITGARLSPALLDALAGRVGMGLANMYAAERATEAEVARRSEELKSAVLDAVAHEIRNPLNSVKLAATTLLSGRAGSEVHKREMLTIIEEEADRMDRVIDEAVQLSRMEASDLSLKKEPQNIAQLIPAAVEAMGDLAARRSIELTVPESLPPAACDKDMILRVIKQLLNNALKYSPEGSPLKVSAEFTGTAIVVDVVDHGPGIAEGERDRIFEKYYRGRAARSGAPGTGLGLASAKCIVEAHGGEIWVTSPPGGGAAFHVALPVAGASHVVGTL